MPNPLDSRRLFEEIESLVRSTCTVPEGMSRIIDFCCDARPHDDWGPFRRLDWESDVCHLSDWLQVTLREEKPPAAVTGLWFGLFNPVYETGVTADVHVMGGVYDCKAPMDWAVRPIWFPERANARSRALDGIYTAAYGEDSEAEFEADAEFVAGAEFGEDAEYALCLTYAGLVVRWLATRSEPGLLLGDAPRRILEVGFDSGDVLHIGTIAENGLTLSVKMVS